MPPRSQASRPRGRFAFGALAASAGIAALVAAVVPRTAAHGTPAPAREDQSAFGHADDTTQR